MFSQIPSLSRHKSPSRATVFNGIVCRVGNVRARAVPFRFIRHRETLGVPPVLALRIGRIAFEQGHHAHTGLETRETLSPALSSKAKHPRNDLLPVAFH